MGRLATIVGQALAGEGVRAAFGVVGNGNFLAVDGLVAGGARYVAARHEGGAIAMADAYYRATGEVAVCTTTYGPGLTNAATGLAEAVKHRSGVLLLSGDQPASGPRRIDIDQAAFAAALGASTVRITGVAGLRGTVARALELARCGPCPVVLSMPADLLGTEVSEDHNGTGTCPWADDHVDTVLARELLGGVTPGCYDKSPLAACTTGQPPHPSPAPHFNPTPHLSPGPHSRDNSKKRPAPVDAVLDLLGRARRPLLLAGLGAYRSGAAQPIAALADRLGGLLTTTVMADGLYRGNPWSLGICGGFASPRAAAIIGDADAVVAFGASLSEFTLHGGMLLDPRATLVQVDLEPAPTSDRVDLHLAGDAAQVAKTLLDGVRDRAAAAPASAAHDAAAPAWRGAPAPTWRDEVADGIGLTGWEHERYDDASTASRIDPRTLALALAGLLPAERTLVMDGGHFVGWPGMYWPSAGPSALVFTGAAFQTIGLGFAGAVGAATGRPDRTTVVALGDGGALMGLPDLETLIRVAGSALVVIFNDAAYGAEVHMYRPLVADTSPAAFGDTDFAAVARSLGARAATVRSAADLAGLRAWRAAGCPGTYLLDCKIVPDVVAPFLADLGGQIRAGRA